MPSVRRRASLVGVCFAIIAGCGPSSSLTIVDLNTENGRRSFGFLVDGQSTRSEIQARLGEPDSVFEGQRIVTYALSEASVVVSGERRQWARYELVLVFDERDILRRHSLIQRY